MKKPLRKAVIYAGLVLSLTILSTIGFLSYRTLANLLSSSALKSHTFVAIESLEGLYASLMEAESGRRGFILTGDEKLLSSYHQGVKAIGEKIRDLRLMLSDDPKQQGRLDRLVPQVERKLANLHQSIVRMREAGYESPVQARFTAEGKAAMDEVRALIAEIEDVEKEHLQVRTAAEKNHVLRLEKVAAAGMAVSVLLILSTFHLLRREVRKSAAGTAALRESENTLRALMNSLTESAFLIDPRGQILTLNETAARRIGRGVEEAVGTCVYDYFDPDVAAMRREKIEDVARSGRATRFQDERSGRHFDISIHPVLDSQDEVNKVAVFAFDITAHRQAERKLQESSAVLERSNREIRLLSQLGEVLQSCLDIGEAYRVIARFGAEFFPGDCGALFIMSASRNMVEAVCEWGGEVSGERIYAPEGCWALRRGQPHLVGGTDITLRCRHVAEGEHHYLCAPMMAQTETLGVLHLQFAPDQNSGELELKRQLALTLAEQVSMALASLRLREKLRDLSIRDPLTGLLNRRYMEEALEREISRADRTGSGMGVIMIDVDHFKRFNDTFGHEAGDAILRELGRYLLRSVRESDIVCRYGGEEFTLILPDARAGSVRRKAERLREGAELLNVSVNGRPLGPITLSLGVAIAPADGRRAETLLHAADAALYRAKKEGRNRVCFVSGEGANMQQASPDATVPAPEGADGSGDAGFDQKA